MIECGIGGGEGWRMVAGFAYACANDGDTARPIHPYRPLVLCESLVPARPDYTPQIAPQDREEIEKEEMEHASRALGLSENAAYREEFRRRRNEERRRFLEWRKKEFGV